MNGLIVLSLEGHTEQTKSMKIRAAILGLLNAVEFAEEW